MSHDSSSSIRTLSEAARYLETLINLEQRPELSSLRMGLDPIRDLLARVGNPQTGLSVIHIAGSKGKGSTALFAESVLGGLGERVGAFTSPHLERWTERFRIAGKEVTGDSLADAVATLQPHVDALRSEQPDRAPTFFDATTAAALLLFARADVDRVILEVGLGGRLDSTNIVSPAVTCITSIELEHTDKLGETHAEIAAEKAGILKPAVPCVVGRLCPEAQTVVQARAAELGAPLRVLGRDFEAVAPESLGVLGTHQADNAALALEAVTALGLESVPEFEARAVRGLAATRLPGRVELLSRDPWIVVDSAHTPASAERLVEALAPIPSKASRLLLSISGGKDLAGILELLLPRFDAVMVTRADPHRSLPPAELAREIRRRDSKIGLEVEEDPREAARRVRAELAAGELLCVTGSVYLAGIARGILAPSGLDGGVIRPPGDSH